MAEEQKDKKLKMHSPDLTEANIEKLAELFPNCVTEAKDEAGDLKRAIDFDQLRQELSDHVVDGPRERYQLNWPGKREALLASNAPIAKTLRPCREESVDFDSTKNLFIEGDNLDALKLLQETYLNKVKMIYIDPPYNTGKDYIYRDSFTVDRDEYEEAAGYRDEFGGRLVLNTETNGRFHSDWLTMLYSRLRLARTLLADDGFIFISIGDDEVSSLRHVCDEVWGGHNFVAQMIWNTEGHTDNQYDVKVNHEYVVVYAKSSLARIGSVVDPNTRQESNLWKGYAENSITKNGSGNPPSEVTLPKGFPCLVQELDLPTNAPDERFFDAVKKTGYITRQLTKDFNVEYPVRLEPMLAKQGALATPCRVYSGWANVDKLRLFIQGGCKPIGEGNGNTLTFFLSQKGVIYYRRDREKARNVVSVLRNLGTTEQMRSELERLGIPFQYPKPKQLLSYLLKLGAEEGGVVLDFYAGSCTTAHAVMERCAEDADQEMQYIMVQLPEPLREDEPNQRPGYEFCVSAGLPPNIAEISKERLRRCGKAITNDPSFSGSHIDRGFRVLKVDSSNMKDVYYTPDTVTQKDLLGQVDNIKEDRTDEDLLFQVLLDWGVDLSLPIKAETIAGKKVYFVDENALAACFETGIDEDFVKALAEHKPLRAVFRDGGYGNDSTKINVEQIFKLISPTTEVKTI